MKTISPFLWFDTQAEEAANFYVSIFRNSKVSSVNRVNGKVLTVSFVLDGQEFTALNGGPNFAFTEAVSFVVNCETQAEVDDFWEKLSRDGRKSRCGWLKDKFGLSWQVVSSAVPRLLADTAKSHAVVDALTKMDKIIIKDLEDAYASV